jgi:UDP-N-acetylglucosamine 4-epimerase
MKKILITGGAGFIGSNLARYFLEQPSIELVRVLDNFSTGYKSNINELLSNPKFELIEGDIRDYDTVVHSVKDIDGITHQAALGSVPRSIVDPITSNNVNVLGSMHVFHAAKEAHIKKVVFASSSSVYGDDPIMPKLEERLGNVLSPYAAGKKSVELYAHTFSKVYDFHFIGLRYFNVFGPYQNKEGAYAAVIPQFISALLENKAATIFGDGSQTRDFTYIDNVIQVNAKALLSENAQAWNQFYNVACNQTTSLNEIYQLLKKLSHSNIDPHYVDVRKGDIKDSLADISKAQQLLNYSPTVDVKEGLEKTFNWFKNQ